MMESTLFWIQQITLADARCPLQLSAISHMYKKMMMVNLNVSSKINMKEVPALMNLLEEGDGRVNFLQRRAKHFAQHVQRARFAMVKRF